MRSKREFYVVTLLGGSKFMVERIRTKENLYWRYVNESIVYELQYSLKEKFNTFERVQINE